ncbi:MAG TPA: rRNA adenine N-6-methyltransferase family protein [Flavobacteriales bacterium]|nr:rRNA adenine N-6-methyltransferase family protein [Flavobacteriales bacterium]
MAKKTTFLKEFFKEKKVVGAIAPSSKILVKTMLGKLDVENAKIIVEYGPGTGPFTIEVLRRMAPDAKLLVFETQESFCEILRDKIPADPRLEIINDSAEKVGEYLHKFGFDHADIIISSLPFTVIPNPAKTNILNNTVKFLNRKGIFTQYQYSLNAHKLLKARFKNVKVKFSPFNLPPAFVYTCTL